MSPAQEALRNARAAADAGRLKAALQHLEKADEAVAGDAAALAYQGRLLLQLGRPADALRALERCIALQPPRPAVLVDQALALQRLDRNDAALEALDRALGANPDHRSALQNRAAHRLTLHRPEDALADADRLAALAPDLNHAHRLRGRALTGLGRLDEAMAAFEQAIILEPSAGNISQRAVLLDLMGDFDGALAAFDRAVALAPADPGLRRDRAFIRLRLGDYAGGWRDYEHRWMGAKTGERAAARRVLPRIDLDLRAEDLAGKSVLVFGEQGVGDQIMFASILPDIAASARIVCAVDRRLTGLFRASFPGFETAGSLAGLDLAGFDRILPIGSLGRAYRHHPEDFPGTPYLRPGPEREAAWRRRLGPRAAPLRIGLAWRGGLRATGAARRSLSLEALRPLLALPGCEIVSLQYGDVAEEVAGANQGLERPVRLFPAPEIEDFEDQAALIAGLDIVVSVQQTAVHLCGALGKRCLVMMPSHPEWRYGAAGETMPWYNSVRLFRQAAAGDWTPVIGAIRRELSGLARSAGA